MKNPQYQIVFRGEIKPGFDREQVIGRFAELVKRSPSEVAQYFTGASVVLRQSTQFQRLNKMRQLLQQVGMVVYLENTALTRTDGQQTEASNTSASTPSNPEPPLPPDSPQSEPATTETLIPRKLIWKYRIDSFMAKGGSSSFKALGVAFLALFLLVAGVRGLLYMLSPETAQQYEGLDFFGNAYITFLQLTDPGNMAQDILSSPWYKLFAVISGLAGVIMLSALVAVITTALDQKINELKRGHSKVIEQEHTLILGWNEQRVVEIIRELIMANESEKDACVVILADEDKEAMDDILRLRLPERSTTRIVTRSGRVSTLANLDLVSLDNCSAVIVLANCSETDSHEQKLVSDAMVIQTILAVSGRHADPEEGPCVVAEIFDETYRDIIAQSFSDNVVIVNTSDILAKLLVQTSRSVGLSVVYNEILSFDGCEMYFYEADWKGLPFGELAFHFGDGVPMGVRNDNQGLMLNPPSNYHMQDGDQIVIVADDDSTILYETKPVAQPIQSFVQPNRSLNKRKEKELIVGWNNKAPIIVREFSDYVIDGSEVDILLADPTNEQRAEIANLAETVDHVNIRLIEKVALNREHLLSLKPAQYDNIIILAAASDSHDAQQVDSENIVILLLLRSIFTQGQMGSARTKLITEVLDSQNHTLVAKAGVKDIIISNRLVSMIIAQISQSKEIKEVYDDLFEEDGSEIYLKPASLYFDAFPVTVTFADLIGLAAQRDEICIGYKAHALEGDAEENNGVKLIPDKNKTVVVQADDSLVVLAEDEL